MVFNICELVAGNMKLTKIITMKFSTYVSKLGFMKCVMCHIYSNLFSLLSNSHGDT